MDALPFTRVEHVARTGSTNTDLRQAVLAEPEAWPHLSVLVADHQAAGRGRSGRSWQTPPGVAVTASVLLRPDVGAPLAWVTALAGRAVQRATARLMAAPTGLKWPNDVLALDVGEEVAGWGTDRKIAGVLAELATPPGGARPVVVLGIGVNVDQTADQLPVPWASSMRQVAGRSSWGPPDVLAAIGQELLPLLDRWQEGDVAGLRSEIAAACVTLGRVVEVHLPGGATLTGTAESLDEDGALLVRTSRGAERLMAGDVLHVRKGPPAAV